MVDGLITSDQAEKMKTSKHHSKQHFKRQQDANTSEMETRILGTDEKDIQEAARILREGGLVAFPTETVYGLGADAMNDEAVGKVYAAKGRPATIR